MLGEQQSSVQHIKTLSVCLTHKRSLGPQTKLLNVFQRSDAL